MKSLRAALTTVIEVVGLGLISAGAWTLMPAAGLIVTGFALVLLGWGLA